MINFLISDKLKFIKIIICILILLGLGLYNHRIKIRSIYLSKCVSDPKTYDNYTVIINPDAKIVKINENSFIINYRGITIPVLCKNNEIINNRFIGAYISLKTIFHKEGYLEAKKLRVHKYRRIKMLVSLIMAIIFLLILFRNFKFNFKRMVFEEKKCRI